MSEVLATSPALAGEAPTVEGRLADIIEMDDSDIWIEEYRLSKHDRGVVISALRLAAAVRVLSLSSTSRNTAAE